MTVQPELPHTATRSGSVVRQIRTNRINRPNSDRLDPSQVATGLRAWARGCYAEEAAVELLVRGFDGRHATAAVSWVRACQRPGWFWLDGDRLLHEIDLDRTTTGPGERFDLVEGRVLTVVGSLLSGAAVADLSDVLAGLDRPLLELVLAALAHTAGSHDQVTRRVEDDMLIFHRPGAVISWPDQATSPTEPDRSAAVLTVPVWAAVAMKSVSASTSPRTGRGL